MGEQEEQCGGGGVRLQGTERGGMNECESRQVPQKVPNLP